MKNALRRISLLLVILMFASFCLTACTPDSGDTNNGDQNPPSDGTGDIGNNNTTVMYSLVLTASKTEVARGDSVTLSAVIKSADSEEPASDDVEYIIESGAEYASITGNILTVNNNASHGSVIKVKAREGATDSNVVEITVNVPATDISISASGATNLLAGSSAVVNCTIIPTGAAEDVTFVITEGSDVATVSGNVLVVKSNATTGRIIKVKAISGDLESNELTFTVGYPLDSISVSTSETNVESGRSAQLYVSINPTNATNGQYTWQFVEGGEYATVVGDVLTVKTTAPTGAKISVKAVAGDITSNTVEFTVGYPLETLTAALIGSTNIKNGNSAQLTVSLNPTNATNGQYVWEFVEGADYATIVGNIITVKEDAPVGSMVKIVAVAGDIKSNEISIMVGTPIETITASSTAPAVLDRGGNYPLSVTVTPTGANADAVTWVVEDGKDYVSVVSNFLTVSKDTPAGTKVTLYAASGSVKSNVLEFTVGVVLESIEITLVGSPNVDPDGSRTVSHVLNPSNASDTNVTWVVDSGADYVTIVNGIVTVKSDAPIGAKVTFHAEIGAVKSNSLTITVGTPIEAIEIEAIGSTEIVKGNTVGLSATLTPSKASASLVSWIITEGAEYASIKGTTLIINSDAKTGASVKVKAVFDTVESNELEFTVMATQEEINAAKYFLDLNTSNIRIDKKGTSAPVLTAEILNGNYDKVTDMGIEFTVISGAQYLGIVPNGSNCTFTALGHGEAMVEVRIAGTDVTETVSVDVIVPPDSIALPEVFAQRPGFTYSFSKVDPFSGLVETLPFVPTVKGAALACTDLAFSFAHESGVTGSEVATYADGKLTFHKTGKITVTVTSASGSKLEATTSYTFNINEGYNVHTFEELSYVIEDSSYKGNLPINIVVLEKPDGSATGYTYGYDIVPSIALLPKDQQTIANIFRGYLPVVDTNGNNRNTNMRIQAVNKGLWLNGNNHKIDVSQVKVYTLAEYDEYAAKYGVTGNDYFPNNSSLFSAETWYTNGPTDPNFVKASYNIRLYDLEVKGNVSVDYDPKDYSENGAFVGAYTEGISIGNFEYDTHYYIDSNNLTASGFKNGLKFNNIVGNGKISNLYVYNCYSTGIMTRSSIVTLENLKIGKCGATGIELSPEDSGAAGLNNDEKSKITIAGTVDASANLNDGNTTYFQNYNIQGATVPQIITGNTTMYHDNQVAHIRNSNGQFIFVSLLFNDMATLAPNQSIVEYPAFQEGGIINIAELPTDGTVDTTHQFVKMDIYVTITGLGTVQAGSAYFYNHNYGK